MMGTHLEFAKAKYHKCFTILNKSEKYNEKKLSKLLYQRILTNTQ
jgi:hypothetical protein